MERTFFIDVFQPAADLFFIEQFRLLHHGNSRISGEFRDVVKGQKFIIFAGGESIPLSAVDDRQGYLLIQNKNPFRYLRRTEQIPSDFRNISGEVVKLFTQAPIGTQFCTEFNG